MGYVTLERYVEMEKRQELVDANIPFDPGTFEDLYDKHLKDAYHAVMTKGLTSLEVEVDRAMREALQWQEDTQKWEAAKTKLKRKKKPMKKATKVVRKKKAVRKAKRRS
jgi:pyruvate-formate lyase